MRSNRTTLFQGPWEMVCKTFGRPSNGLLALVFIPTMAVACVSSVIAVRQYYSIETEVSVTWLFLASWSLAGLAGCLASWKFIVAHKGRYFSQLRFDLLSMKASFLYNSFRSRNSNLTLNELSDNLSRCYRQARSALAAFHFVLLTGIWLTANGALWLHDGGIDDLSFLLAHISAGAFLIILANMVYNYLASQATARQIAASQPIDLDPAGFGQDERLAQLVEARDYAGLESEVREMVRCWYNDCSDHYAAEDDLPLRVAHRPKTVLSQFGGALHVPEMAR